MRCEVYSRVVGYLRPVNNWNVGKKAEYSERVPFSTGAPPEKKTVVVDGDSLAELSRFLLERMGGMSREDVHREADWLRTNGHELAGEQLEILATAADSIAAEIQ